MKILYGVVGEGMGHATRSRVILSHLAKSHEIEIVVSGRAHEYLSRYFFNVHEIKGLKMAYENNEVDRGKTFWELLKSLPSMIADNFQEFIKLGERFSPDVVVSDFESFAYTFGKHHDIPVISIDNMQIINRCELDVEIPDDQMDDYLIAKGIVKGKLPGCFHYLITTFFYPPISKERTSLYPPILRDRILGAEVTHGDHIIIYQTSTSNERLLEILDRVELPFRVYGFNRDERVGDNVWLRPFSEEGFIADLASCRGVLATGGFSLMGEAVYLGKPLLSVPLRKQFEQQLNSLYLARLGYGEYHDELSVEAIVGFSERMDSYAESLKNHHQDGNTKILDALDRMIEEAVEGSS